MGRKPTGGKPGRKYEYTQEQIEFLDSFAQRYQKEDADRGEFYTEFTTLWIERFGYTGLNPHTKAGISIDDLQLDVDIETLDVEEQTRIKKLRATARDALRTVTCRLMINLLVLLISRSEIRQLLSKPIQFSKRRPTECERNPRVDAPVVQNSSAQDGGVQHVFRDVL